MSEFLDGPAAGVVLSLRRAPVMLRVVRSAPGDWDALDQAEDEAKPGEQIFLYWTIEKPRWMHLCIRGKGKAAGGFYEEARYRQFPEMVHESMLRSTVAFRAWCQGNHERVMGMVEAERAKVAAGKAS